MPPSPVIYEASFLAGSRFHSVDILERRRNGYVLRGEVDTGREGEHIPDVAHPASRPATSGPSGERAEVMHLNRDCRHPDLSNLFVRQNVTPLVETAGRAIPRNIGHCLRCCKVRFPRCPRVRTARSPTSAPSWPDAGRRCQSTMSVRCIGSGRSWLQTAPGRLPDPKGPSERLRGDGAGGPATSERPGARVIVERGLQDALAGISPPIAFLDFETVPPQSLRGLVADRTIRFRYSSVAM